MRAIFPAERKIVPVHSRVIEILATKTYYSTLSTIIDDQSAFTVMEEPNHQT